jgi:hypothetical protein
VYFYNQFIGTAICTSQTDLIALFAANMYVPLDALLIGKMYLILRVKYFTTYDDGPRFFMLLRYTWNRDVLAHLPAGCAGRFTPEQLERINRGNLSIWCIGGGPGSTSQRYRLNTVVF